VIDEYQKDWWGRSTQRNGQSHLKSERRCAHAIPQLDKGKRSTPGLQYHDQEGIDSK
jgi:hypothetical protein